jgi:hypothetical protein
MARLALALISLLAIAAPASAQLNGTAGLTSALPGCNPIDPAACLLPWPNDFYTKADPTTATGKRLNLLPTSTPRNIGGKPIDVLELNRHDGFSPGSAIITRIPGLDTPAAFKRSKLVPEANMAKAFSKKQPAVVIDAATGKRQLIWAELDMHSQTAQGDRVLIIRPGKNWLEGHRYIVALRNLKDASGRTIQPNATFRAYRDGTPTDSAAESRRAHMENLFGSLKKAKIDRRSLYLAWDFTVASERDRSERILAMRDAAFMELGDGDLSDLKVEGAAPEFTVDSVTDQDDGRRKITGTFTVPCFLDKPGCVPGSRMLFAGPTATLPTRIPDNTQSATYTCYVPTATIKGEQPPSRPSLYGHGLLGGQSEVGSGPQRDMVTHFNMTYCATDWYGFATEDIGSVGLTLLDASNFPLLADRMQQGFLAFHFLGRLAIHPEGFSSDPAFKRADGSSAIDTTRLYYDGNSQGGIMGGALVATSPDITRGVLGVPAMNYSTLLQRSVDFESDPENPCPPTDANKLAANAAAALGDPSDYEGFLEVIGFSYACPLYASYPSVVERQLVFGLMQQLWDRGEANGYAQHMTSDPLPNTPAHEVLLHGALGDHQVTQVAMEVEARTIGARVRPVAVDEDRTFAVTPQYGIPKIESWPFKGSAMEIWDSGPIRGDQGNDVAPLGNVPNRPGRDPHSDPRATKAAQFQKSAFLKPAGRVEDHCGQFHGGKQGQPCYSRNWKGSTGW